MLKDYTLNKTDNQNWLKAIGIFQIIGGILGLLILINSNINHTQIVGSIIFLLGVSLFGLSIFAGVLTFKLIDNCLKWTITNQILQVFAVFAGNIGFQYTSGFSLDVGVNFTKDLIVGVNFNLSSLQWSLVSESQNYYFGFNLVAISIIYKIEKIKADIKTKKEQQESLQKP